MLVLIGCGSAIFNGGCGTPAQVLMVAMAFGLAVVAMAYTIGGISGCHINPAITLGVMLSGRMKTKDGLMYMLFQVAGAVIGSAILYLLTSCIDIDYATRTGANVCQPGVGIAGGFIAELVFTFIFVLVVLGLPALLTVPSLFVVAFGGELFSARLLSNYARRPLPPRYRRGEDRALAAALMLFAAAAVECYAVPPLVRLLI